MTDDLVKRLNTAGGFDSPWLREQLLAWSAQEEQKKADFMEHMYNCSGRQDKSHPMHALYTGLWQDFCIKEAGPYCRQEWFDMVEAVRLFEQGNLQTVSTDTKQTVELS
jgi:hypothetical protein